MKLFNLFERVILKLFNISFQQILGLNTIQLKIVTLQKKKNQENYSLNKVDLSNMCVIVI